MGECGHFLELHNDACSGQEQRKLWCYRIYQSSIKYFTAMISKLFQEIILQKFLRIRFRRRHPSHKWLDWVQHSIHQLKFLENRKTTLNQQRLLRPKTWFIMITQSTFTAFISQYPPTTRCSWTPESGFCDYGIAWTILWFIRTILKSLVILAMWLALSGTIYSRIVLYLLL